MQQRLFQAKQQLDAPSINLAQQSPVAPAPSQSPSDSAPSPTPSNPAPSPDTQKEVNDHNQKGIDYYNLGIHQGDPATARKYYQDAVQEFTQAIDLKEPDPAPGDAKLYVNRGNAYSALGNNQPALQDYSKVIDDLKPDDGNLSKAYEGRGDAWLALYGGKREAINDYEEAIRRYVDQSKTSNAKLDSDRVRNKLQKFK